MTDPDHAAITRALNFAEPCPPLTRTDRAAAIRALAAAGLTDSQIGHRLNSHRRSIYRTRTKHGIPPGNPIGTNQHTRQHNPTTPQRTSTSSAYTR